MVWNPLGESSTQGSPLALARKRLAVAPPVTAIERSRESHEYKQWQSGESTAGQPERLPIMVLKRTCTSAFARIREEIPKSRPGALFLEDCPVGIGKRALEEGA